MEPATQRLSEFVAGLRLADLSDDLIEHLGWVVADTLAAMVAGSAEPELQGLASRVAASPGPASLAGLGRATSADAAALIHGTAGTFLEMDEGNRFSRGHPAIHALPAALALCQERGLQAEAFLTGVLAGYEVGSRIGRAARLRPSMHPHGTWGTVGAAAACARAAGLGPQETGEVINVASSLSIATSRRTMLEGGLVRNVYAGLANRHGLLALTLCDAGFTGEQNGLASVFGQVVSDGLDELALLAGLGTQWHIQQNYFKRHACCRFNHGTLDALDLIDEQQGLPAPSAIAGIEVESYHLAAELKDPAPRNTLAAKFSVPFAVATRIVHGSSGLASFTWDAVRSPEVAQLAARVSIREDPTLSARLPRERPARVRIRLVDGTERIAEVGVNRGDDEKPYSRDELSEKFVELCGRVWPSEQCDALLKATLALGPAAVSGNASSAWTHWIDLLSRPGRSPAGR